jgi:GNAT superfamily N-acetyltransferase
MKRLLKKKAAPAKKTPAKQLNREINEALAKRSNGNGGMERVTRERVLEPLVGERIAGTQDIEITLIASIGPEPWKLVSTRGRNFGGANGGRILITLGGLQDPLAGLAWATEYGRPYVHHVWVDSEARGRGLSQVLFDAYRAEVSPELVVVGPFTKAGRAAAERAGATIEE